MSRQVVIEDESDGSFTLDGWLKHFIDDIHNFQSPTLAIDRSSGHREILISLERQKNNSNGDKFRGRGIYGRGSDASRRASRDQR